MTRRDALRTGALCLSVFLIERSTAQQHAAPEHARTSGWHVASNAELRAVIPERAPVVTERIETEFRTASGIQDRHGHCIAGVVLITAGYSAEGKYSHYVVSQVPLKIGDLSLSPGDYVFGWTRSDDGLAVKFYQAATGKYLGQVDAKHDASIHRVESFRIWPPSEHSVFQLGRFTFPYTLPE